MNADLAHKIASMLTSWDMNPGCITADEWAELVRAIALDYNDEDDYIGNNYGELGPELDGDAYECRTCQARFYEVPDEMTPEETQHFLLEHALTHFKGLDLVSALDTFEKVPKQLKMEFPHE